MNFEVEFLEKLENLTVSGSLANLLEHSNKYSLETSTVFPCFLQKTLISKEKVSKSRVFDDFVHENQRKPGQNPGVSGAGDDFRSDRDSEERSSAVLAGVIAEIRVRFFEKRRDFLGKPRESLQNSWRKRQESFTKARENP